MIDKLRRLFGIGRKTSSRRDQSIALLAEHSADVIFHFAADLKARYISPSAEHLLGWTPYEIMATGEEADASRLIYPEDRKMVATALVNHLSGTVDEQKLQFRMLHRNGHAVWVETNCRTVKDETGKVRDLILTMRDISSRKKEELELRKLARTDGLTGLANRRCFDELLERQWRDSLRRGEAMSLLIIDIDFFKQFNDCNGHQVGDDCLRAVASVIDHAAARPSDKATRYGGEEFALLLPNTDQAGAMRVGEALRAAVEELRIPHPGSKVSAVVTVSIGSATAVATTGGTVRMPEGLLQAADHALYRAKAAGRNRVEASLLLSPTGETSKAA